MLEEKHLDRGHYFHAGLIFFLAAMFYLYEFSLQVSPSVMTSELMQAYSIAAPGLGTISAFYYYGYTPMQLPAGVIYDYFGPRLLMPVATLICALGALFFAGASSVVLASTGRFLMGFGAAFSFVGTLLLISRWLPTKYFALFAGLAQLMSSVGAIFGQIPLAHAVNYFGWRPSVFFIGILGMGLALLMALFIKDYPKNHQIKHIERNKHQSVQGLKYVFKNKQTWLVGIYAFTIWSPMVLFAALWGVPYIQRLYHISTALASTAIAMMWIGVGIGSPFVGWLSDKIQSRNKPLLLGALIGVISSLCLLYVPMPFPLAYVALFFLGLSASGQALSFGVIKDITPPRYVGTAVGMNNMMVVAGGALFQPLVGMMLHFFWNGTMRHNIPIYSAIAFRDALWIMPVALFIAFLLSYKLINETHCQSIYTF